MSRKIWMVTAAWFAAASMLGCAGNSANTSPPATAASANGAPADDDATAGLVEHHRHHHHGGVTLLIAMSLDTLGVTPEQRAAVEKIRGDLHAEMKPASAAEQNLATLLADGVAAANIDAAKVDAAVAEVSASARAVHDAAADALNQLHAVLTPEERAALVDKVEAHWAVWEKANADETGGQKPNGRLAMLAKEIDLTPDQVEKVSASFGEGMKTVPRLDSEQIAAHLRAFGDAFRSQQFDAKALTTGNGANERMAGWGAAYMAHFVEAVSPVLTPEQRTAFAQTLHEHASHNPSAQVNP